MLFAAACSNELGFWASFQKMCEQKERARRLMRLASCLQSLFHPGTAATETYELVCWRSGTVASYNARVVSLQDDKTNIFDGWWTIERYTASSQDMIKKSHEVIEADVARAAMT